MARKMVARVIVAVLLGILTGYAVGKSLAKDAADGRALTLKEYIAEFENHKKELSDSDMPMALAVFSGVLMVVVFFGVYELLVFAVDKLLHLLDRRGSVAPQPRNPRGW
jgi:Na+/pantothenate symporter